MESTVQVIHHQASTVPKEIHIENVSRTYTIRTLANEIITLVKDGWTYAGNYMNFGRYPLNLIILDFILVQVSSMC